MFIEPSRNPRGRLLSRPFEWSDNRQTPKKDKLKMRSPDGSRETSFVSRDRADIRMRFGDANNIDFVMIISCFAAH